jgi:hypothetical protein
MTIEDDIGGSSMEGSEINGSLGHRERERGALESLTFELELKSAGK